MPYTIVRWFSVRTVLAVLMLLSAPNPRQCLAEDYIFWVDQTDASLYRSRLDGSEAVAIVEHLSVISDVYVDDRQQALYFTDSVRLENGAQAEARVLRSDLNGSQITELFPFPILYGINHLAVDSIHERLYYTEGSRQCTFIIPFDAQTPPVNCFGGNDEDGQIALDLDRGRIFSIGHGSLSVADLGTFANGHQITVQTNDNRLGFRGITLDPDHEHVYWAAGQFAGPWGMIQRAHWDRRATAAGSPLVDPPPLPDPPPPPPPGVENVFISQSWIEDIAVDSVHDKLYWIQYHDEGDGPPGRTIRRANLDGTGVETLLSNLSGPVSLALYVQPIPEPSSFGLIVAGLVILLLARRASRSR